MKRQNVRKYTLSSPLTLLGPVTFCVECKDFPVTSPRKNWPQPRPISFFPLFSFERVRGFSVACPKWTFQFVNVVLSLFHIFLFN
jgi:hypothetical protein